MLHNSNDLIILFNHLFKQSEQTILVGGAEEPLYLPKNNSSKFDQIFFKYDYFASALHEIAHWCIAGNERRKYIDYNYWYKPDGRNSKEQLLFQEVEIKPQALECIFAEITHTKFSVSIDNINNINLISDSENNDNVHNHEIFKQKIYTQVKYYKTNSLPPRAKLFQDALHKHYPKKKPG